MLHVSTITTPGRKVGYSVRRWADQWWYDFAANAFVITPSRPVQPITESASPSLGSFELIVPYGTTKPWPDGIYEVRFHDLTSNIAFDSCLVRMTGGDDMPPLTIPVPPPVIVPALVNGGFESPAIAANTFDAKATPDGWSSTPGAFPSNGSNGFTITNPPPASGQQVLVIQRVGSISQAIPAWPAGTYAVLFRAAMRGNYGVPNDFKVTLDGATVGVCRPADKNYASYASDPFTVEAGDHTLAFLGLNTAGGDNTSLIDDVRLARLP